MKSMFSKSDDLPPGQYETDHILKWNVEHPGIIPENPKINTNCVWKYARGEMRDALILEGVSKKEADMFTGRLIDPLNPPIEIIIEID